MTPDDYKKVKEIFQSVLDAPPEQRTAELGARCSDDPSLRHEVERLLDSYESEYLESPAVVTADAEITGDSLTAGSEIGHYTILEKIGSGGMGEVYLAEDGKLGRQVAIKLLPETFTEDADRLRRFEQEARTASALNHPNILTIFEIGETGNSRYIATEYIDGETLRAKLNRGLLPVADALEIAVQCASAIAAAHENGIIHRDIKPENIMLRRDDLVKVLDFGLAKLAEPTDINVSHDAKTEKHVKTAAGVIMGTVQYMSPEQTRGHATDVRTDIWSLGVVIYEMLSGEPPFTGGNSADLIAEIVKSEPPKLSDLILGLPAGLDEIVSKTIRKDPDSRYQSAKDLLLDLTRLKRKIELEQESETIVSGVKTDSAPNRKPLESLSGTQYVLAGIKLHRGTAIWIFALIAALLVTSAFLARKYWRINDPNEARFAYAANIRLAAEAMETSNLDYAKQLLDEAMPKKGEEDLRDFEWGYLSRLHDERMASQPITLKHEGWVNSVAFSADGETLATGSNDARLWEVSTGQQKTAFNGHSKPVVSVVISPDGTELVTGSFDLSAKLWEISGEKLLLTIDDPSAGIAMNRLAFSSDGKTLYTESAERKIRSWEASTGKEILDLRMFHGLRHPFAWSHDGRYVAGQSEGGWAIDVKEIATGRLITTLKRDIGFVTEVTFAPDARSVLVSGSAGITYHWELPSGKEIGKFDGVTCAPSFSHDGKLIAMCSEDAIKIWDLENGFERAVLRGHVRDVNAIAFSPDGRKLASGGKDNTAKIWNVPPNDPRGILRSHTAGISKLAFSRDGKLLASGSDDKTVKLWDVESERERLTLRGHAEKIITAAFSPNGVTLATAGADGKIFFWDVVTGKQSFSISTPKPTSALDFSPDGKLLVTGHWWWEDPEVRLWSTTSGEMVCSVNAGGPEAWNVEFTKDGKHFITVTPDDAAVRRWNTSTCGLIATLHGSIDMPLLSTFGPDGKLITLQLINNDRSVKMVDLVSGKDLMTFSGHEAELSEATTLSPDAKRFVTGDETGLLKIWDVVTGQDLLTIRHKAGEVANAAFSPSGNILAVGSSDGAIRFYRSDRSE